MENGRKFSMVGIVKLAHIVFEIIVAENADELLIRVELSNEFQLYLLLLVKVAGNQHGWQTGGNYSKMVGN